MNRREILWLVLIFLAALGLRAFFLSKVEMVWPDEAYYMGLGFSMAEGREYGGFPPHPFEVSDATKGKRHGQPPLPYLYARSADSGKIRF